MTSEAGPHDVAEDFVRALIWGEHVTIWELLSNRGRSIALNVAVNNGMDRVVAGRIEQDLADPTEREEFLAQLHGGLCRDLRSVELDRLAVDRSGVEPGPGPETPRGRERGTGSATVTLTTPSVIPGTEYWVAGELELSLDDGRWRIDRLIPRRSGP